MINYIPKRLTGIINYIYILSASASTVAFNRQVFILLERSRPPVINMLILLYGLIGIQYFNTGQAIDNFKYYRLTQ